MTKYWIKLNGHSMYPLLRDSDEVLIEPIANEQLKHGDVILFLDQSTKELTLHRLIEFSMTTMTTKGDFSLNTEENLAEGQLGKAIGFKRGGFYRVLPAADSILGRLFLYFSLQRGKGFFKRKMARILLIVLTKVFEVCSDKTRLNHNEVPHLNDPSSHV